MNRNAVNRDDPEILLKSGWLSPTANIFACYCRENWNKTIKEKKEKRKMFSLSIQRQECSIYSI